MGFYAIPRVLDERLGPEAADALGDLLHKAVQEARDDVVGRIDEKVTARYSDIQRRLHEDIAGVEIRFTAKLAELEVKVTNRIGDLETKLTNRVAEVETKLAAVETRLTNRITEEIRASERRIQEKLDGRIGAVEAKCDALAVRLGEYKADMIQWVLAALVLNAGIMLAVAWVGKHLM